MAVMQSKLFSTDSLISRPRPSQASQDQDLFCGVYYRPTEKHFSFSAVNENTDENEISFTAENETKMDIHFRPKNENESQLIILVFFIPFHTFIHQVSRTMRRRYLVQFRLFCRWSLLTGFHFHHVQCIHIFVAFFLDDISTREQFAFLVYCHALSESSFPQSMHCALLASVWPKTHRFKQTTNLTNSTHC